ncbi:MAG TPA: hypothetical protein VMM54_08355 [Nitrospirota bacterium]|nr:hypothetical protein [Nitrospirota bacterium]
MHCKLKALLKSVIRRLLNGPLLASGGTTGSLPALFPIPVALRRMLIVTLHS